MKMKIDRLRFSLIRVATSLPDTAETPPFAERASYEDLFDHLQGAAGAPKDGLALPWPPEFPAANLYWRHYLAVLNPALVRGSDAWQRVVPFRGQRQSVELATAVFPGTVRAEHFVYPFGLAVVVTLDGSAALTPEQWVDQLVSASTAKLDVTFEGAAARALTLSAFTNEWLQRLSAVYFGAARGVSAVTPPFTITTVIKGDGVDEKKEPAEGGDIHRLLFGTSTLRRNWKAAKLDRAKLADRKLTAANHGSEGDLGFAAPRGRAIWNPSSFTPAKKDGKPSLSCYHRNQVIAAMQADSLCDLADALANRIRINPTLSPRINRLGRIAAEALANIYAGVEGTYRSKSLPRQIADRGSVDSVNLLRDRYSLPRLAQ